MIQLGDVMPYGFNSVPDLPCSWRFSYSLNFRFLPIFIRFSSDFHHISSDFLQIFIRFSSDFHQILFQFSSYFHQILFRFSSDFHHIFIRFSSDFHQIFISFSSDFLPIFIRFSSDFLPIFIRFSLTQFYTNMIDMIFILCMNLLNLKRIALLSLFKTPYWLLDNNLRHFRFESLTDTLWSLYQLCTQVTCLFISSVVPHNLPILWDCCLFFICCICTSLPWMSN